MEQRSSPRRHPKPLAPKSTPVPGSQIDPDNPIAKLFSGKYVILLLTIVVIVGLIGFWWYYAESSTEPVPFLGASSTIPGSSVTSGSSAVSAPPPGSQPIPPIPPLPKGSPLSTDKTQPQ